MPQTRKSPLAYGWQLLRRWPWLPLIPLVMGAVSLFFAQADGPSSWWQAAIHDPLPVVSGLGVTGVPLVSHWFFAVLFGVASILTTAGSLYLLAQGLRGERLSFSLFLDGVWEHGLRLLGAALLLLGLGLLLGLTGLIHRSIGILAAGAFVFLAQLWDYTIVFEELSPWPALRRSISLLVNEIGHFFTPLVLGFLLILLFSQLAPAATPGRLPLALGLYPFLGTIISAAVAAAYLQAMGQEPKVGTGRGSVLPPILLTLGVVALVWPFATGLFRHYRAFLPGHEPVLVLEGYQYKTDPMGARVEVFRPNARLLFDRFDGRFGQGRLYVEEEPPILLTVRLSAGRVIRGWVEEPLLGYSGIVGNRLQMQMSADQRIFSLAEQSRRDINYSDDLFADVGSTYAVSQYRDSVGYYFSVEPPTQAHLSSLLKVVVPVPNHLHEPNLWPLRVGHALAQNSPARLLELFEEVEGDWPEKNLIYDLFSRVAADESPVMQVMPIVEGAGPTRTFAGSVIRANGEAWYFSGMVAQMGDSWQLVELEIPALRKD